MFLIPLGHEDQTVQRLPWATIVLAALNVVAFLVTLPLVHREADAIHLRTREVVQFVREHPYLRLPEGLARGHRAETPPPDLPAEVLADQQARLDGLLAELQATASGSFYRSFGYVPARPRMLALFTSLFLHGGWLHLIGNMLFLWLAGPSLEDRWGRGLFLSLYLAGGIVATAIHVTMNPHSDIPVIGASGAIAGLMGAFLVRLGSTRIRFFYWVFLLRIFSGTFEARAYVVLPLWLLQQVAMAVSGEDAGVAVWAHIGGFGFGVAAALLVRVTDLERTALAPAIEKKTTWTPSDRVVAALGALDRGNAPGAVKALEALLRARPGDLEARMALVTAYAAAGDQAAAGRESARIVEQHLDMRDLAGALAAFREHDAVHHDVPLGVRHLLALAAYCEDLREYREAADLYRQAIAAWPDDPLGPKALMAYGRLTCEVFKRPEEAVDLLGRAGAHPRATPELRRTAAEALAAARQAIPAAWRDRAGAAAAAPAAEGALAAAPAEPLCEPPQAQASTPAEPQPASPAPGGIRLVPVPMRAVGIDARGLHLQNRQGGTGLLAWRRVAAISVGRVGGPETTEEDGGGLILDLLTAPRVTPAGTQLLCVRLSIQDLAIPQLQGEPSPSRALQRLVATILKVSGAVAHPSREACLRLEGLAAFPSLAAYDADVVARVTAAD